MHLKSTHRARRRAAFVAVGAVALSLSACGPLDGGDESSSSSTVEPVETTSTSDQPTSSSSSTSGGDPKPANVDGDQLLAQAKTRLGSLSTVTIDGTLVSPGEDDSTADDVPIKLHAEGSLGDVTSLDTYAGNSRTTLTLDNGGTLEVIAKGYVHYVKADEQWFEGLDLQRSALAKHADRWLKMGAEGSPVNELRPNQLIKGSFFGPALTPFDGERASSSVAPYKGRWAHRLTLTTASTEGKQIPRTLWVSAEPGEPNMLELTFGRNPSRTTYRFTKWNETSDEIPAPAGAKTLKDNQVDDLL